MLYSVAYHDCNTGNPTIPDTRPLGTDAAIQRNPGKLAPMDHGSGNTAMDMRDAANKTG